MVRFPDPHLIDEDAPAWTDEQLAKPLKASDIFTPEQLEGLQAFQQQMRDKDKKRVSLKLDPSVIEKFKATGKGWQDRVNEVLKQAKLV